MSIHPQSHTNLIQAVQQLMALAEDVIGDWEEAQMLQDYDGMDSVECTHDPCLINDLELALNACDRQVFLTEIYGNGEG